MKTRTAFFLSAALVALIALGGCATRPTPLARLVIGVQSTKPQETHAAWAPLVADLGRKLGVATELVTASQADTVAALAQRRVDMVWLSSSAAIDAVVDADARAFALYQNVNGTRGYKAVLLARADSGIATLDQALERGRWRYAAGAKTSTSGYVLPQHFVFSPRGTTAEQTFRSVIYGGHPANMEALWDRRVDVAVNNSTDSAQFEARVPGARGAFVKLWESPLVPNDVLMVRADMPHAVRDKLAQGILHYGRTPEEKALLARASGIELFVPADNALPEPVAGFKFATERVQIEQDATLAPAVKAQRLAQLQAREQRFRAALAR
jgi:phosphonate transport system substrate-binding protein